MVGQVSLGSNFHHPWPVSMLAGAGTLLFSLLFWTIISTETILLKVKESPLFGDLLGSLIRV